MQVSAWDAGDQVEIRRTTLPTALYTPSWGFDEVSHDAAVLHCERNMVRRIDDAGTSSILHFGS